MNKKVVAGVATILGVVLATISRASAIEMSGIETEAQLRMCLTAKTATCVLGDDIEVSSPIVITGDISLNLDNYQITDSEGFAPESDGLLVVSEGASLTIDADYSGMIAVARAQSVIRLTASANPDPEKNTKLTIEYGTIYGQYYGIAGDADCINTEITLNDGVVYSENIGIYHPQQGILNIYDGSVSGDIGIVMMSGTLNLYDGAITGRGEFIQDDGVIKSSGAALQIESSTKYAGNINLYFDSIMRLTSTRGIAFYEYISEGEETQVKNVALKQAIWYGKERAYVISQKLSKSQAWKSRKIANGSIIAYDEDQYFYVGHLLDVEGIEDDRHLIVSVSDETKAAITNIAKIMQNENLKGYIGFDLSIKNDNGETIHETDNLLKFAITAMPNEDIAEGYNRQFHVYYQHGDKWKEASDITTGESDFLEGAILLTFASKEFSTYVIAYEDIEITEGIPEVPEIKVPNAGVGPASIEGRK